MGNGLHKGEAMALNDFVIANANKAGTENFLRTCGTEEIFFSIPEPQQGLKDGPLTVSQGAKMGVPIVQLEIGPVALFYTSRDDERLAERFAGMPLMRAAEMICKQPGVEGMLLQSSEDAWLVVPQEALRQLLSEAKA